jgi:hypothetical protein
MSETTRKPRNIGCLLGLPLLLILALLSIPYGIVYGICMASRERRLFRRLTSARRTLPWTEVAQHLRAGSGTLIIEQGLKQRSRLWWTPDDISSLAPLQVPEFDEIDFLPSDIPKPFVSWCYERYLSPVTGTAALTRLVGMKRPRGFFTPDFFTAQFPLARVIATALTIQD